MTASSVSITWLGHSTFLLTGPTGKTVLIDPFVMSNPRCPDALKSFERLDIVAVTHGHFDHVADAVQVCAENDPSAVVAIIELAAWLRSQGVASEVIVEMNIGGTVQLDGVSITMVQATHSAGIQDGDRMLYGGVPAGLILSFDDGPSIYHAGDTDVFGDMALIAELYAPDIALLPIGDNYTMGPRSAAKACELLGVRRIVPMHYGTWPVLAGTPAELRQECEKRGLDVEVMAIDPGQTFT
jgi:L-ascorbate metabolism protein UlaG (beta-lactamase superfamily)